MWYARKFMYMTVEGVCYKPKGRDEFILLWTYTAILEAASDFKDGDNIDFIMNVL